MIKHNNDIRTKAREDGVYLYEIAEKMNVSEPTFNRWLRKELSENLKQKALVAIEQIREEHEAEQCSGENPLQGCYNIIVGKSTASQLWFTRTCYLSYNESSNWTDGSFLGTTRPSFRLSSMLSLQRSFLQVEPPQASSRHQTD